MHSALKYAGQIVFYAAAAALTGYFSIAPAYQQVPPGMAQIKLSFAHGADRLKECRRLTSREIAELPPAQRRPNNCTRERGSVFLQFAIDGRNLLSQTLAPTGFSNDGPARTYQKFLVPAGEHRIAAGLRDSNRQTGFDYEMEQPVTLVPGQSVAVDFRAEAGGFVLR
jgi:hypothetical protein